MTAQCPRIRHVLAERLVEERLDEERLDECFRGPTNGRT